MEFAEMNPEELMGACEAMLFVSAEPVNAITMADMMGVDVEAAETALNGLRDRLAHSDSGIQLRQVAGGWQLATHPRYHELIEKYVISWDTRRLSQAALETLSIVAYNQPITRNGILAIRGVNSDSSISSLIEKGLVREAGREQSPGQPILYATTRSFLERFGLTSLADLPDLESFAPDEESRELIRERLGITRSDDLEANEALFDDSALDIDLADDIVDLRAEVQLDLASFAAEQGLEDEDGE
ncbi:Segregation and condensation protein B [Slackia heliotrinireducens]|uniref:Segregation and condensation protein B n=1 Tax=Slackia heliotrinireducens (strain ATCC 29202 / DSM 20476 / NCTC 11029 / RHS 1) TaxID=471855 RepID=C7N516_SLAHD|nr:SMC-Scp complex subunit ScpB [Slackia heliotrinireducens]ACV22001.1 segregation and condensation protein B [Slackia heliotrinireducens DSM 20476]VEG99902.1 Segregation and condensation protein B [Slackia heliotrinireducens]